MSSVWVSSGPECNVYPFSIELINCGPVFIYGPDAEKYSMGMLFRKRKQTKASIELTAPVLYLGGPVFGSQPG